MKYLKKKGQDTTIRIVALEDGTRKGVIGTMQDLHNAGILEITGMAPDAEETWMWIPKRGVARMKNTKKEIMEIAEHYGRF